MHMENAWIGKICVGMLLLMNGWRDWKELEIIPWSLAGFGLMGIILQIFCIRMSVENILAGMAVGVALMFLSWVSRAAIGMGDGLILGVTGVYLGFAENLELVLGALLMCSIFSAVRLICKKAGRKTRVPFVPFLFAAFLCEAVW